MINQQLSPIIEGDRDIAMTPVANIGGGVSWPPDPAALPPLGEAVFASLVDDDDHYDDAISTYASAAAGGSYGSY